MELTIECAKRDPKAKPNALRREGLLPAVLYGYDKTESMSLTVSNHEAEALLRRAVENNTLINVQVPDASWNGKALIREIQRHPWKNKIYHLSFFAVSASDMVEVQAVINYVGEPEGVRLEGGILNTEINEISIRCEAGDIPESLDIDVSDLKVGDSLTLANLKLPKGVEAVGEPDLALATVLMPRKSEPAKEETVDPAVAAVLDAMGGDEEEETTEE